MLSPHQFSLTNATNRQPQESRQFNTPQLQHKDADMSDYCVRVFSDDKTEKGHQLSLMSLFFLAEPTRLELAASGVTVCRKYMTLLTNFNNIS
jgi:hypothetical protein